ncbi:unnamed protein product [Lathyrus oleraceus]|uniref:uncharacterized protein LOC127076319 n=1 Tax=Pisum sativum TaxID=3888 RepID=UPI0021CEBB0F|nr:uncharacterized protein LOC127076319 [Pisum sativum]
MKNEVDNHGGFVEESPNEEDKKGWRKVLEYVWSWMAYKDKDKWLKQMSGNLGLIATLIATITFQMALNPPGGVRPVKDDGDKSPNTIGCSLFDNDRYFELSLCPGEAVLAVIYSDKYQRFLYWNTICFVASLSVLLLLMSGLPLNHRFPTWLLSIVMCLALTSLALTYITALDMVTPDPVWHTAHEIQKVLIYTWVGMLSFVALFLTLRIIIWGVRAFGKKDKKTVTPKILRENTPPT